MWRGEQVETVDEVSLLWNDWSLDHAVPDRPKAGPPPPKKKPFCWYLQIALVQVLVDLFMWGQMYFIFPWCFKIIQIPFEEMLGPPKVLQKISLEHSEIQTCRNFIHPAVLLCLMFMGETWQLSCFGLISRPFFFLGQHLILSVEDRTTMCVFPSINWCVVPFRQEGQQQLSSCNRIVHVARLL